MTTWIVSRHPGAVDWLRRHYNLGEARTVAHLDPEWIADGDHVIGTLPVQQIANVNARGGCYHHLTIPMQKNQRGKELDADKLDALGAQLECFTARRASCPAYATRGQSTAT